MITLSNKHSFEYMVASGALGFDGKGWWWEKPLVAVGLVKPELFTIVTKTLTLKPRTGNLNLWKPWKSVRLLPNGGVVNKIDMTNPGIDWWCNKIAPNINFHKTKLVVSIFGEKDELVEMVKRLNQFPLLVGLEVNVSCPNTNQSMDTVEQVVGSIRAVREISRHPIILKLSVEQDFLGIAEKARDYVEAISLNSVPWKIVFGNKENPLLKLEGGVSGRSAQAYNWDAVKKLVTQNSLPVIAPSIMEYNDLAKVRDLGASALSFGAIHLRTPWKPTAIVEKEKKRRP